MFWVQRETAVCSVGILFVWYIGATEWRDRLLHSVPQRGSQQVCWLSTELNDVTFQNTAVLVN
jgi:hypothetical protein